MFCVIEHLEHPGYPVMAHGVANPSLPMVIVVSVANRTLYGPAMRYRGLRLSSVTAFSRLSLGSVGESIVSISGAALFVAGHQYICEYPDPL